MTSGIPNLQLNAFVVDIEVADSKVHSDSRKETLVEDIVCESAKDVGLACATVTDNEYLEDVVELLVHSVSVERKYIANIRCINLLSVLTLYTCFLCV